MTAMRCSLVALLLALSLCQPPPVAASERSDYEKAQQQDTIEAYQTFLSRRFKEGSKLRVAAFNRLDELKFERAVRVNTIDHWFDYMKYRPEPTNVPGWAERSAKAKEAHQGLVLARVRADHQAALASPTWESFNRFWDRYPPNNVYEFINAELPQLHFEVAEAVGTRAAYEKYAQQYPDTELTQRLKHGLAFRPFQQQPDLYAALHYLHAYPNGEHSARVRQWIEADQSTMRAGDLRLKWLDGLTTNNLTVPTGEVLFSQGGLKPLYKTLVPKQGVFLVASFAIYNTGPPRLLEMTKVWLGDGKGRRFVATELSAEDRSLETLGVEKIALDRTGVGLPGFYSQARALFDLPRSGHGSLRLYVDGVPTLRVADMPPRSK